MKNTRNMKNMKNKKIIDQTTHYTPYAIYGFFRSFRKSLQDEGDFADFISTLTITPMRAVVEMVLPFFHRSSDPSLLTKFQMLIRQAEQSSDFESTLLRVCDAIDMLEKVEFALREDKRLMDGYLKAMQFDNASASHQQVWSGLQRFLNEECDHSTKRRMERVFAEQKAGDELGLNDDVLATANALVGDDSLYIEILETLQLNNRQNLPWSTVIKRIQNAIGEKKPEVWQILQSFLNDVHSGCVIDYDYYWSYIDGIDIQYDDGNEETIDLFSEKFANITLDSENDGVNVIEPPQTQQQEQRKQQREVIQYS